MISSPPNFGTVPSSDATTTRNDDGPATERAPRRIADWRVSVVLIAGLWAVIYMIGLSWPALLDDVDTVHAEAAREMIQRHDWVTLYTDGLRYLEKAPMMYWSL